MSQLRTAAGNVFVPAIILCLVFAGTGFFDRPAASYDEPEDQVVRWEYHTTVINSHDLQATLDKLAADGWEVSSIIRHELQLVQESGTNYLRTTQLGITARRRAGE